MGIVSVRSAIKKRLPVTAFTRLGNISTKVRFLNPYNSKIKALIDEPVGNQACSGIVSLKGWAFSTAGAITKIEAFIDKTSLGPVLHGFERPDVKEAYPNSPNSFKSGFITTFSLENISPGAHKLRVRVSDSSLGVRELVRPITKVPAEMELTVETPVENSILSDIVKVSGWSYSKNNNIEKIEAFLDEQPVGVFRYGQARPDVVAAHSNQRITNHCGFSGSLDLTGLTFAGSMNLAIRATDSNGNQVQKALFVKTEVSKTRFILDTPQRGTISSGILNISGWLVDMPGQVDRLEVFLDDQYLGRLKYGIFRPDVIAAYQSLTELNCGFVGWLEFPVYEPGFRQLRIRATDVRGFSLEREIEIEVRLPGEPLAEIDKVRWYNNILEVEGWAILPTEHPPVFARIFINSKFVCETRVRYSRPDVWQRFRTRTASATSGFRVKHLLNNPEDFGQPKGSFYNLTVEAVDKEGWQHHFETHIKHEIVPAQTLESTHWNELIVEYQQRYGENPSILDWFTDTKLANILTGQTVFSPSVDADSNTLPYIDQSIDLVLLDSTHPERLSEARRIAGKGVINLAKLPEADTNTARSLEIEWLEPLSAASRHLPSCTVIIPTYNGAELTHNCLKQLVETVSDHLEVEFLVMDDASTDNTEEMAPEWLALDKRIRFERNPQNLGFLRSSNRGARLAKGEVIVFLNNDTLPQPGWLAPLLQTLKDHPEAGAVGGKLIYPNGLLQEAGGIIFSDGEGWNFGRFDYKVNAPTYSYLREVDYCSGALLATWRDLFLEDDGFDNRYVPMYYEDVDYCFSLRAKGKKVYFQPESAIIHLEGGTAGTDLNKGFKAYQLINYNKFIEKWSEELKKQPLHPDQMDLATKLEVVVRNECDAPEESPTDSISNSEMENINS